MLCILRHESFTLNETVGYVLGTVFAKWLSRDQHSTHDSPLNFFLILGAIRLVKSEFRVECCS